MVTIKKLFEKEYYFRKLIIILSLFMSKEKVNQMRFIHQVKLSYHYNFGKKLHLRNPQNLNEKLIWLSLFWKHPVKSECADKYKVRSYLCSHFGIPESLFIPLIGVWSNADDIDFSLLPSEFVLKCNHGCGYNIIVQEKGSIDIARIKEELNNWLSDSYHGGITELHYTDIFPRLIICEELIPTLNQSSIIDYKIHCFNGNPSFILVCYNRDINGNAKLATFNLAWEQLFFVIDEQAIDIPMPSSLPEMISYSKLISQNFPFVRIDFYDIHGNPYIGELTFTPYGNMIDYYKEDILIQLGKSLHLPPKHNICFSRS